MQFERRCAIRQDLVSTEAVVKAYCDLDKKKILNPGGMGAETFKFPTASNPWKKILGNRS